MSALAPLAIVRCECGETELELQPGAVVPRLVCPQCPSAPTAPARPTLTLIKGGAA